MEQEERHMPSAADQRRPATDDWSPEDEIRVVAHELCNQVAPGQGLTQTLAAHRDHISPAERTHILERLHRVGDRAHRAARGYGAHGCDPSVG